MSDAGVLETLLRRIEAADGGVDSLETASVLGVDHQVLVGAVKSLLALEDKLSFGKIGFSKAMSNKWVKVDKTHEGGPRIFRSKGNASQLEEKEKNETVKSYWITKGSCFSTTITKPETELTPEMIANGSWKEKKFKPYNFEALGVAPDCGHLHPLMKVRTQFRQIFLEMGFTEMPTNNFIESSFWNFDSLFQPQQHPARDAHDTFFISGEFSSSTLLSLVGSHWSTWERVKKIHSEGGYGSQGYKYDWKIEEAQKNILRTHTTAVSARMLYKLAQQYFSIDRVFRNETLDATHLAEFHQIEGVVADRGLTLGDLMGTLHQFFTKLEPSMEVFSYHEGLKKVGGGGELGGVQGGDAAADGSLPEDVTVIAWAFSGETHHDQIRHQQHQELVGHKVDLQMVYDGPICRLES
ncbi:hypothetical protein KUCAC02_016393 [Chaenocephalus aceratus]|nr:hypothetical protein KUCAC02_016393 [Chaenocephalus aceratus]